MQRILRTCSSCAAALLLALGTAVPAGQPAHAASVDGDLVDLIGVIRNRALDRLQSGDYAGASADLDLLINHGEADAGMLRLHALAMLKLGKPKAAIAKFGDVVALAPTADNFRLRGTARQLLGDLAGAIADFDESIAIDDTNPVVWSNRGVAKMNLSDYEGATFDLSQALELKPDYIIARFNRALARFHKGEPQAAIDDYDIALAARPNWEEAKAMRREAVREILYLREEAELREKGDPLCTADC